MNKVPLIVAGVVLIFCCFVLGVMILLVLIVSNSAQNRNDLTAITDMLKRYEVASLELSAIANLRTSSVSYDEWQERIDKNSKNWKEIEEMIALLKKNNDTLTAESAGLIKVAHAQEVPSLFNKIDTIPLELEQKLLEDTASAVTKQREFLQHFSQVSQSEYQEVELTTKLIPKDKKLTILELMFMAAGSYIPFVSYDPTLTNAAQMELTARTIAYFAGADLALAQSPTGTIIFHKIAQGYFADDDLVVDTSRIAPNASLYTISPSSSDSLKVTEYPNFKEQVDNYSISMDLGIGLDGLNVSLRVQQDKSGKPMVSKVEEADATKKKHVDSIELAKASFARGEYTLLGQTFRVGGEDKASSTPSVSDTSGSVSGIYSSDFLYKVPVIGAEENVSITVTITNNQVAVCKIETNLPYSTYVYPGTSIEAGISGSGSGQFEGTYNSISRQLYCSGTVTATTTSTILGSTDTATLDGVAEIRATLGAEQTFTGTLGINNLNDFHSIGFTLTKQD